MNCSTNCVTHVHFTFSAHSPESSSADRNYPFYISADALYDRKTNRHYIMRSTHRKGCFHNHCGAWLELERNFAALLWPGNCLPGISPLSGCVAMAEGPSRYGHLLATASPLLCCCSSPSPVSSNLASPLSLAASSFSPAHFAPSSFPLVAHRNLGP